MGTPIKVRWLGRAKKGYEHTDNVKIYEADGEIRSNMGSTRFCETANPVRVMAG